MHCRRPKDQREIALTITELLVLLLSVGILAALLLPATTHNSRKAPRLYCTAQLKQIALGCLLWANENALRFPMEIPIAQGGTKEHTLAGNLLTNYSMVANQIGDARILLCSSRQKAKTSDDLRRANNQKHQLLSQCRRRGSESNTHSRG